MHARHPCDEAPDFGQDLTFQRREWVAERIGWTVIAATIAAALLGLTGDGPLSRTVAASPDGSLRLGYDRFARVGATTTLRLRFRPVADLGRRYRIWLEGKYRESMRVREVSPMPDHVEDDRGRLVYVFRPFEPERSTDVTFFMHPRSPGLRTGRIGLVGGTSVAFRQLVYP